MNGPDAVRDEVRQKEFARRLVRWYDPKRGDFPWRQTTDPYRITVCEILLQRTRAETAAEITKELFRRFPKPAGLAHADAGDVRHLLKPLGLPRRADQVQAAALAFTNARKEGRDLGVPELAELPGVGDYVIQAVRVMAFAERDAMIDANTMRVLRRVFDLPFPARDTPPKPLREFALRLVPSANPKEYNLALLDLGRLVCLPTNPRHQECPVLEICDCARRG